MMDPDELLRWLCVRDNRGMGIPMGEIDAEHVHPLEILHHEGKVHITIDPPMVWLDPSVPRKKPKRKPDVASPVFLDSDLPSDVPMMKHQPDRASQPMPGLKLNGEPVYMGDPRYRWLLWEENVPSKVEASELIMTGDLPWPPNPYPVGRKDRVDPKPEDNYIDTSIKSRWCRPARAKWTTEEYRDLVVTSDTCPVCGRAESKRTSPSCLACDHWPSSYPTTVRTLEAEPDDQPKPKAKKKGAKAS